ncbi:unnamed protein product, partial [Closterium sp. NIES-53]
MKIAGTQVPPPIPPGLSEDLADFIASCLHLDPRRRPAATALLRHPFVLAHSP